MAVPTTVLNVPIVDQVVNRFFYDFVCGQAQPGKVQGFLSFLPDSFKNTSIDSLLHNATLAVAFANYQSRRRNGLEAIDRAKTHYGKALLRLKDVLENPIQSSNSDTLLGIYILSMFEVLSFPKYNRGSWAVHTAGAVALLGARNVSDVPTTPLRERLSRKIMWTMMIDCLRKGTAPIYGNPEEVERVASDIETEILQLMHQAAKSSASMKNVHCQYNSDATPEPYASVSHVSQLLESFYLQASVFHTTLKSIYLYSVESLAELLPTPSWLTSILNSPGHPNHLHHHPNTHSAYLWNMFHATQLRVAVDQLGHLELTPSQKISCLANINTLTNSICSSVHSVFTAKLLNKPTTQSPHDVCGVRAYAYLFPLSMTAWALRNACEALTRLQQEQKQWEHPIRALASGEGDVGSQLVNGFPVDDRVSLLKEMTERARWTQLVLEQMQWDFGVSGNMSYGDFDGL